MRALVMGYHTMGCLGFDALLRHGFTIPAVFTHEDDPKEEIWWESLAERAATRGIPVHTPTNPKDPAYAELVRGYQPDFLFSFYYRYMIPQAVLDLAPRGALNLHGSLLPRYRGRAPVNWVLVNGERETGVSLHYMVAKPDAGELVDQEPVPIAFEDTAFTLFRKLEAAATKLLDRSLPLLLENRAPSRPLDLTAGTYFGGRKPQDGRIDWTWDAVRIYDLIRAVTHPYPGAFTDWGQDRLYVWWALPAEGPCAEPGTVTAVSREGIVVACGKGALRLITLQKGHDPELPACALARLEGIAEGTRLGPTGDQR